MIKINLLKPSAKIAKLITKLGNIAHVVDYAFSLESEGSSKRVCSGMGALVGLVTGYFVG